MAVSFDEFRSTKGKRGDLYLVQCEGSGTLVMGDAVEPKGEGRYRVYFSFLEDGKIFDSSVFVGVAEIRQVVRNGIAVWFNRG